MDGFFFALAIIFCLGNGLSEAFYFWTGFIGSAVIALTAFVDVDKLDSTAESFVYFLKYNKETRSFKDVLNW